MLFIKSRELILLDFVDTVGITFAKMCHLFSRNEKTDCVG